MRRVLVSGEDLASAASGRRTLLLAVVGGFAKGVGECSQARFECFQALAEFALLGLHFGEVFALVTHVASQFNYSIAKLGKRLVVLGLLALEHVLDAREQG